MSKHRVLGFKPQLRLEWRGQDGQPEAEQPDHSASLGDSNVINLDKVFGTHRLFLRSGEATGWHKCRPPRLPQRTVDGDWIADTFETWRRRREDGQWE
jgi:hypothetical protein